MERSEYFLDFVGSRNSHSLTPAQLHRLLGGIIKTISIRLCNLPTLLLVSESRMESCSLEWMELDHRKRSHKLGDFEKICFDDYRRKMK